MKVFLSFTIIFTLLFSAIIVFNNNQAKNSDKPITKADSTDSDSISFLLMGVDGENSKENENVRTDTLMVFNVDKDSGKISILSVPRDTRTPIKGRKYQEKINHAHVYGGDRLTLDTVSDLLGIDLEYYVVADYNFVKEFVDLVGGVEIDVPMDMHYEDPYAEPPLYIDLKEGLQKLDGDESLQYLRFRKGYKNADLGRIDAQQTFVKSLVKQSIKPINLLKAPQMVMAYNDYINTNIPLGTIIKYTSSFYKYDLDKMNTQTLPGEPKMVKGVSYFIHYEEKTKELVKEMFDIENEYSLVRK